jgi:FkbM family methyltransferase
MEDAGSEHKHADPRLTFQQVIEAFQALTPSKQGLVLERIGAGLVGETPDGLRVTGRNRKELRRFTREKDHYIIDWMRRFEPGDVFYDIGANCGGLTLTAGAMHGERVRIVAIEPSFGSFESLARNLSANGMLRFVVPLQVALLDRTGLETMFYRSTAAGTSQHGFGAPLGHMDEPFDAAECQFVPVFKLDDLIPMLQLPAPTRVKIDVDGYEGKLLQGCSNTLSAGTIRDLIVEVVNHDHQETRLTEVRALLSSHGYELVQGFHHAAPSDGDLQVADYLFQRSAGAEALQRTDSAVQMQVERASAPQDRKAARLAAKARAAEEHERQRLVAKEAAREAERAARLAQREDEQSKRKADRLAAKRAAAEQHERDRVANKQAMEALREAEKREIAERRSAERRTGRERRKEALAAQKAVRQERKRAMRQTKLSVQRAAAAAEKQHRKDMRAAEKRARVAHRQQRDEHKRRREEARAEFEGLKSAYEDLERRYAELQGSYYLSGSRKKIDIPTVPGFADVVARVKADGRLGMDYDRLYSIWQAVQTAPAHVAIVEVGAYLGGSARFIVEAFKYRGEAPRFYVCDTFRGHARVDDLLDSAIHREGDKFLDTSAESVAEYLSDYSNVQLLVGDIVETASQLEHESEFGLVHVDVDVYPATDFCVRFFAPRLAKGALLIVDDYGFVTCPGAKRAVDDFIAERCDFRMLHLLSGQAVIFRA